MKDRRKLTEIWFKLGLLVFFSFLYLLSTPYPEKAKQFPQLIAIFSFIMIVISLVIDFIQKGKLTEGIADVDDTELKVFGDATKKIKKERFFRAWGIILVSTGMGFLGGFLFSTFFLFMGFAIFFGGKKNLIKNVVISVLMTILIYLSFQWIMGVPLLTGILLDFP
jgi:hypothetical protein